ncbi:unnamed protein product [Gongylonema pulchrum]|uniref:Myosin motor domain-containing protein n=1 Tax=Gongylonema pulchrum TaxID=637853 RepID=A0A183D864_9BILA|nr:unnamed protein product [Gongylonema pulchrum]
MVRQRAGGDDAGTAAAWVVAFAGRRIQISEGLDFFLNAFASATRYLQQCILNHQQSPQQLFATKTGAASSIGKTHSERQEFAVRHYAGQVWYDCSSFIQKNRWQISWEAVKLLAESQNTVWNLSVAQMFRSFTASGSKFAQQQDETLYIAQRYSRGAKALIEKLDK